MTYSVLYNNSAHVVKCKGLHFVYEKHLHDHVISIKVEVCVHKICLTLHFYLIEYTKPGEWMVIYIYARGVDR
jgi:hypothetical protein